MDFSSFIAAERSVSKVAEVSRKLLLKPPGRAGFAVGGLSSLSKFPPWPSLNHPCKNANYVCMFKKKRVSSLSFLDPTPVFVLAQRPGSAHTPTLPNGDEKFRPFFFSTHVPSFYIDKCEKVRVRRTVTIMVNLASAAARFHGNCARRLIYLSFLYLEVV